MILYLDTSSLVKLYIEEPSSEAVPSLAFTSFDGRLNQAAAREGLTVLMP